MNIYEPALKAVLGDFLDWLARATGVRLSEDGWIPEGSEDWKAWDEHKKEELITRFIHNS